MAVVELLLPALPEHVRTARLVVVAAARRAGLADGLIDELRLAVGEACARAVRLHSANAPEERVRLRVTDDVLGLSVAVDDDGPEAGPALDVGGDLFEAAPDADADPGDIVDPDVSLALLAGLVDEIEVDTRSGGGTTVTMRWPLPARTAGTPSTAASQA